LVELMVGHQVEQLYPDRASGNGQARLDVRNVTAPPHVRDVSFEVNAGEIVGIGGLVGAGRTELLRAIYGLDQRTSGEVIVDGQRLPRNRPSRAIAAGLGLAPEERTSQGLLLDWSVTKNVSLADLAHFRRRGLLNHRAERDATQAELRALHTTPDDPGRIARELSGGNQQKVVLARWLLHESKVLLLDEPTRGVDVATKAELYRVMRDLAKSGVAIVMVSSELEELAAFCTRVLIMRDGRLVADLVGATTSELELLRYAVGDENEPYTREEPR
jgi:ribose transport system ATP-binding protein